jgi:hypothetical protein
VASVDCLAVVDSEHVLESIAVDDSNVYWTAYGQMSDDAVIVRLSRAGGKPVTLAEGAAYPSLVSDGSYVYFADVINAPQRHILRVPVDGGAVMTVASASYPSCLTVDDQYVYWTDSGGVRKAAKSGGDTVTIVPSNGSADGPIVVDDTSIYWAPGGLYRVNKDGGATDTLLSGSDPAGGGCDLLGLSAGGVIVVEGLSVGGPTTLVNVPLSADAGGPTTLVGSDMPTLFAAGATELFWTGFGPMLEINETPIAGGPTTTLAMPDVVGISDMALASDGTLYWTSITKVQSLRP